jgi:hypothetical protein
MSTPTTNSPKAKADRKLAKCPPIREMQLEVEEGRCVFCEKRLRGNQRARCADAECVRAYQRVYHGWMRAQLEAKGLTQRGQARKNKTWVGRTT